MPSTPPTAPAPTKTPDILGPVLQGFAQALHNPTIAVMVGMLAVGLVIRGFRFFRWLNLTSAPRDQMSTDALYEDGGVVGGDEVVAA